MNGHRLVLLQGEAVDVVAPLHDTNLSRVLTWHLQNKFLFAPLTALACAGLYVQNVDDGAGNFEFQDEARVLVADPHVRTRTQGHPFRSEGTCSQAVKI